MEKKWYLSKTLWVNAISLGLELAQIFLDAKILPSGTLLVVINCLNIALRFLTKAELKK